MGKGKAVAGGWIDGRSAPRVQRLYLPPGLTMLVWADGMDLPWQDSASATDQAMRKLASAIEMAEVVTALDCAGIKGILPASAERLRMDLCKLMAEPLEADLQASVAHLARRLAPDHDAAAILLHNIVRVGETMKMRGDRAALAAIEPFTRALLAFQEAAKSLMATLPPPPPRQSAPWHSDACWLANRLLTYADESKIDVGISRAGSAGVRFVVAGLQLALGLTIEPAAVAKALQRNRDN